MSDTLASAIDALWHPLPGAGFTLGYGTNGFTDHSARRAPSRCSRSTGYGAIALTLGHPHLDPFAADADEQAARLRERLDELGWRVVVETGTRYLLDPFVKHRPTLVDVDAEPRACGSCAARSTSPRCCVPTASRSGRASLPDGRRRPTRPGARLVPSHARGRRARRGIRGRARLRARAGHARRDRRRRPAPARRARSHPLARHHRRPGALRRRRARRRRRRPAQPRATCS